ncbi:hypothetical protein RclHR1_07690001 [Rhizophagus clarus]|uniref:Uncharacterized protein n=1 Tax=Rhizophagus clarus TaxID=94130 RepID=A0A2Z6SLI6_9GLOM|nr:hypothetical protein RclHR1_07690001 [Rhizophagus clarus]GES88397.1 hypothetical protein RCL_e25356_RclHR1_07690001 [Rhizophagus clarus]
MKKRIGKEKMIETNKGRMIMEKQICGKISNTLVLRSRLSIFIKDELTTRSTNSHTLLYGGKTLSSIVK